jgi:hypothetical protein
LNLFYLFCHGVVREGENHALVRGSLPFLSAHAPVTVPPQGAGALIDPIINGMVSHIDHRAACLRLPNPVARSSGLLKKEWT